jgi:hypothetical protein
MKGCQCEGGCINDVDRGIELTKFLGIPFRVPEKTVSGHVACGGQHLFSSCGVRAELPPLQCRVGHGLSLWPPIVSAHAIHSCC